MRQYIIIKTIAYTYDTGENAYSYILGTAFNQDKAEEILEREKKNYYENEVSELTYEEFLAKGEEGTDDFCYLNRDEAVHFNIHYIDDQKVEDLRDGYQQALRQSIYNHMQIHVPGYSSCRLGIVDLQGQNICLLCNSDNELIHVMAVILMPDASIVTMGQCGQKIIWVEGDQHDTRDYEVLEKAIVSLRKTNEELFRAFNPLWLLDKHAADIVLDYINMPYAEYLRKYINEPQHEN